ncbi:DUF1768-domain-containing protein [Coniophora puteana RWD-64-598 SS2]|uniref:DUF1768-domain-containing protein n=1 Tax=Coniophora puteana (strain RWD-64-598) TaxID=741705 RepID=A0A5M3MJQ6_CONPW|nr:DUF1768-domain-containing protein [Coniophora puteana RWD-64-598 SS2]EIW79343.1 DUF1768-domain-containing protein [Coniophora puteana RWD-64-598 SS2]
MGLLDFFSSSSSSSKRDRSSPSPPPKQPARLTKERPAKFRGSDVQHSSDATQSNHTRSPSRPCILFYDKHKPFYEFTNFSSHPVQYNGKTYPTCEHLFQSFKFMDEYPDIAELIRTGGDRPMAAFDEAHRYQNWVRPDWRQVNVAKMEEALYLKFTQNRELKKLLLDTGDAELVEDSPWDYFWGVGANHSGRNELGRALERLRDDLSEFNISV